MEGKEKVRGSAPHWEAWADSRPSRRSTAAPLTQDCYARFLPRMIPI